MINGQIHLITNPTAFFAPILLGSGGPTTGFANLTGGSFVITMTGFAVANPTVQTTVSAAVNATNGTFSLHEYPTTTHIDDVSLNLAHLGQPFYRSAVFKYTRAKQGNLNIYLFQPVLPASDGVAAGVISTALASGSLPGNTTLSSNPWGIGIVGSKSGADIQFGITLIPHTSTNLNVYADLALQNWNIHVGFPADWCTTAHDILTSIRTALVNDDGEVNVLIKAQIIQMIEKPPLGLSAALATSLVNHVSITFSSILFPVKHTWALSNTKDTTVVMNVHPTIGYPRGW